MKREWLVWLIWLVVVITLGQVIVCELKLNAIQEQIQRQCAEVK